MAPDNKDIKVGQMWWDRNLNASFGLADCNEEELYLIMSSFKYRNRVDGETWYKVMKFLRWREKGLVCYKPVRPEECPPSFIRAMVLLGSVEDFISTFSGERGRLDKGIIKRKEKDATKKKGD